jgi:hypothetical protein
VPTTTTLPTTTTTQPPTPEPENVLYFCVNVFGNVQPNRIGTYPRECANATDRHVTVKFAPIP